MGVYELSGAGSVKTGRTLYTSMNAGNMYGAMVPISSTTLSSNGAIVFDNIPQTFQDLFIVIQGRSTKSATTDVLDIVYNGDFSANYSGTRLYGNGTSALSDRSTSAGAFFADYFLVGNSATAGIFSSNSISILNYANTSTFKTTLVRSAADQNGSGGTSLAVGLYRSTSGISRISLFPDATAAFLAGTSITLYGIRAVSS